MPSHLILVSIHMCLLNIYSVPSTVLGVRRAKVSKTRQVSSHEGFSFGRWVCGGRGRRANSLHLRATRAARKSKAHRRREGK